MSRHVKALSLSAPPLPAGSAVLAVDLGGTWIRTALVRADGTVSHRRRAATPSDASGLVGEVLEGARAALAAAGSAPLAICVSAPGPLDRARGVIEVSANLPAGHSGVVAGIPLVEPLAVLGLPVVVERDTNVAALGEGTFGASRGVSDFAYVTVSTGIGASIVWDGRVLTGAHGHAGEIGHFPVAADGPLCGCGNRGCLEALASGAGIAAATGGRAAVDVAAATDDLAVTAMTRARAAFASGMVGLVNAYDPGLIVVGGSVARGQGELYLGPARAAVRRHAYGAASRDTRVVPAQLGDDAGLLGAIPLAAQRLAGLQA
ncbi:ROK family protein [Nonomuraea sp. CA-143628]|uniref:ROK family protein n=1 Tax=Nonomuraea sp. CA-143628 TaxID=3239997 RepID=UPI003D8DF78A